VAALVSLGDGSVRCLETHRSDGVVVARLGRASDA
jgi:hypothetical protein